MRIAPWQETRIARIHNLFNALAEACLSNGSDQISWPKAKEIARHVLDHCSTRTMYDYFEDLQDSQWVERDGAAVRLLRIPPAMAVKMKKPTVLPYVRDLPTE
jgi:hypothetical protein